MIMLDLGSIKTVTRNELQSTEPSPRSTPDPDLEELLRSRLLPDELSYAEPTVPNDAISDDDETELRLFAGPATAAPTSVKIKVASPEPGEREPGFIVPNRPRTYYFADVPDEKTMKELEAVAVTGEAIIKLSKAPWPGCALPWKVRTISSQGLKKQVLVSHTRKDLECVETRGQKRRSRAGKKKRLALRKKLQAVSAKEEEEKRKAAEREQEEREKRTRKNREKKVKKKAKEKAKKIEGQASD